MKGLYLTEECKQEIENQINDLSEKVKYYESKNSKFRRNSCLSRIFTLQEILESATILPVEESWECVLHSTNKHKEYDYDGALKIDYPKGIIIQPKKIK
jgi:hypothetical protein